MVNKTFPQTAHFCLFQERSQRGPNPVLAVVAHNSTVWCFFALWNETKFICSSLYGVALCDSRLVLVTHEQWTLALEHPLHHPALLEKRAWLRLLLAEERKELTALRRTSLEQSLWSWSLPLPTSSPRLCSFLSYVLQTPRRWETLVREWLVARWHSSSQGGAGTWRAWEQNARILP